jgi:four helix bundle protein
VTTEKEGKNSKPFDLEERTCQYAKGVFSFVRNCPKTIVNTEIVHQLVRSAGSVGANYIEAREALSKKDFALRVKICRKETKERAYWLRLLEIKRLTMKNHDRLFYLKPMNYCGYLPVL